MKSLISKTKFCVVGPKWLKYIHIFYLKQDVLDQIRGKIEVKTNGIVDFASIHVFTEQELQEFIQNVEKRVYNNIACAKTKGNC